MLPPHSLFPRATSIFPGVSSVFAFQKYLNNTFTGLFLDFSVLDNSYCLVTMEGIDLILPSPHTHTCLPSSSISDCLSSAFIITSINTVYGYAKSVHYC